ncbi:hypothetical protein IE81DRAFT_245324 [Ceraceosorus guamensis]|uniref:Uncharacterized protein n=1 Tax=Ceraceosorus guamensis TaxID=1522189 RepID=A0A316VUF7_9BASI|nr:hypothetical protein IE81DRAFT_245324 [Ceraceosorus guamensis]PWN40073.1 hypothetical protein IE81DRAFT_245324 [Ceraceosorus guamensis]
MSAVPPPADLAPSTPPPPSCPPPPIPPPPPLFLGNDEDDEDEDDVLPPPVKSEATSSQSSLDDWEPVTPPLPSSAPSGTSNLSLEPSSTSLLSTIPTLSTDGRSVKLECDHGSAPSDASAPSGSGHPVVAAAAGSGASTEIHHSRDEDSASRAMEARLHIRLQLINREAQPLRTRHSLAEIQQHSLQPMSLLNEQCAHSARGAICRACATKSLTARLDDLDKQARKVLDEEPQLPEGVLKFMLAAIVHYKKAICELEYEDPRRMLSCHAFQAGGQQPEREEDANEEDEDEEDEDEEDEVGEIDADHASDGDYSPPGDWMIDDVNDQDDDDDDEDGGSSDDDLLEETSATLATSRRGDRTSTPLSEGSSALSDAPSSSAPSRQRAPSETEGQLPATKRRRFGQTDASSSSRVAAAGSSSNLLPSSPTPTPTPAHQAGSSSNLLPSSPISDASPSHPTGGPLAGLLPSSPVPTPNPAPPQAGPSSGPSTHGISSYNFLIAGTTFACRTELAGSGSVKVTVGFMIGHDDCYLSPVAVRRLGHALFGATGPAQKTFRLHFKAFSQWKGGRAVSKTKPGVFELILKPDNFSRGQFERWNRFAPLAEKNNLDFIFGVDALQRMSLFEHDGEHYLRQSSDGHMVRLAKFAPPS